MAEHSDYAFIDAAGSLIAMDAMYEVEALIYAQKLAIRHRGPVTLAKVVKYNIEPPKCNCGEILDEWGACPDYCDVI